MTAIDDFRDAMIAGGLIPPKRIEGDDKTHRCATRTKPKKRNGAFCFDTRTSTGWFHDHSGSGGVIHWPPAGANGHAKETPEEKVEREAAVKAAIEKKRKAVEAAAAAAVRRWDKAKPAEPTHPYLVKKAIKANGLRQEGNVLLVPMFDAEGKLSSLQTITAKGDKLFSKGSATASCSFVLGDLANTPAICIGEGFATMARVHETTGVACIVAFSDYNLVPVTDTIAAQYPDALLILCADDDYLTVVPGMTNPGLTYARRAASHVPYAVVAVPVFGPERAEDDTDFADMVDHDAVTEIINDAIAEAQWLREAERSGGIISFTNWRDLRKRPIPQLVFAVDDLIRHPSSFLIGGDSGAGKSISAQTWCTCMAAGLPYLGRQVRPCIAAYFTGEDDSDVLHVRQERINKALGIGERDLDDRLFLCSIIDREVYLFSDGKPTSLAGDLEGQLSAFKAGFAIIDSATLVYDDDEIRRRPVAAFMRNIGAMGRRLDASIGLIAHTSRSSRADATHMVSGSTSWVAQARAGLLFEAQEDAERECDVVVKLIAGNYTKRGQRFELVWSDDGVLLSKKADDILVRIHEQTERKAILDVVGQRWDAGAPLSAHAQSGGRWLPRVMAALTPPMKAGRAEKLMIDLIARGDIIDDDSGRRVDLRLPHQAKKT